MQIYQINRMQAKVELDLKKVGSYVYSTNVHAYICNAKGKKLNWPMLALKHYFHRNNWFFMIIFCKRGWGKEFRNT